MRDEYTEWQDYAKRGKLLNDDGTTSDQPHPTAVHVSWFTWEARSKLTKPLNREQRRALFESAWCAQDEDGILPDMARFEWIVDAVERAHGVRNV